MRIRTFTVHIKVESPAHASKHKGSRESDDHFLGTMVLALHGHASLRKSLAMPLLDHFHPPLSERRKWHSFHHAWATVIAFDLNHRLPPGYFADPNVQYGIEIDVAAFEEAKVNGPPPIWTPPAPTMTMPITLITDIVEVQIYSSQAGPVLIGAIELVSPANKDRPASRDAFVFKCASFVQQGIGLI